jgi:hypothetical protein
MSSGKADLAPHLALIVSVRFPYKPQKMSLMASQYSIFVAMKTNIQNGQARLILFLEQNMHINKPPNKQNTLACFGLYIESQ